MLWISALAIVKNTYKQVRFIHIVGYSVIISRNLEEGLPVFLKNVSFFGILGTPAIRNELGLLNREVGLRHRPINSLTSIR